MGTATVATGWQVVPSRQEVAPVSFNHSYAGNFADLGFSEISSTSRNPEHGSPGTCPGSSRPAVLGHLHTPGLPVEGHCHLHLTNEYIETQRSQDVLKMCLDLFQTAGHTDTEMTVMKEGVYSHSSLETGGTDVM